MDWLNPKPQVPHGCPTRGTEGQDIGLWSLTPNLNVHFIQLERFFYEQKYKIPQVLKMNSFARSE